MNAPAVAIYIEDSAGYSQVRVAGLNAFPQRIGYDDAAMVAMRAEEKAVDIAGIGSELGSNACVFPMLVFGSLYGVIVCADRPGEHFPEYEMSLVTEVAQVVGAARRILLTKDNDAYVREMASGALTLTVAKQRARRLVGL
jgi:hypothetical protein